MTSEQRGEQRSGPDAEGAAPVIGPGTDVHANPADAAGGDPVSPAAGTPGPGEETIDTPDDLGGTGADAGGAG